MTTVSLGVDLKLSTGRAAISLIALGVDAITITVLIKALPRDYKITVCVQPDTGEILTTASKGVDLKLIPERIAGSSQCGWAV